MIVNAHEGTALEVFWRHRGTASWSYLTALRFLSQLRLENTGIQSLRELLAGVTTPSVAWKLAQEEVLQRVATLIGQGRIIVVENAEGKLWPDSGLVLRSRGQSFVLLSRKELAPGRDMAEASRWVHKLQEQRENREKPRKPDEPALSLSEKAEQEGQRRQLGNLRQRLKAASGPDYSHLPDAVFLAEIERVLQTGRLVPLFHPVSGISEETAQAAAPPPVAASPASSGRSDEPDPNTFDPAHSGPSQGAALISAAEDGVPFCEVCQRGAA